MVTFPLTLSFLLWPGDEPVTSFSLNCTAKGRHSYEVAFTFTIQPAPGSNLTAAKQSQTKKSFQIIKLNNQQAVDLKIFLAILS